MGVSVDTRGVVCRTDELQIARDAVYGDVTEKVERRGELSIHSNLDCSDFLKKRPIFDSLLEHVGMHGCSGLE